MLAVGPLLVTRRRVWTFVALALCSAALAANVSCGGGEAMAPGVTRAGIRGVQLGMTEEEVVKILGQPLAAKLNEIRGVKTLEYTRPVRTAWWYPMLWVHLKGVNEVYAKRYVWWGIDHEGAYGLSDAGRWEVRTFEVTFRR
jgi:hypothetical protein